MAKGKGSLMEAPKNGPEFKLNPGSTSILLIFVTLCLVAFAVLCVVSSNSDRKLGGKVIDRTTEYYSSCNHAQRIIAQIDDELVTAYNSTDNKQDFYTAVGGSVRTFVIDIDSTRKLHVSLSINYPENEGEAFYKITSWYIETISEEGTVTIE